MKPVFLALTVCLAAAGCGGGGDWKDEQEAYNERERVFVDQQTQFGMSEDDAKRQFWLHQSILETEQRTAEPTAGTSLEFEK